MIYIYIYKKHVKPDRYSISDVRLTLAVTFVSTRITGRTYSLVQNSIKWRWWIQTSVSVVVVDTNIRVVVVDTNIS